MTNDADGIPRRKTLSIKRARPADKPAAEKPVATKAVTPAPRAMTPAREPQQPEQRGGRLYAVDENMRRMQADMDKLGMKKDSSSG